MHNYEKPKLQLCDTSGTLNVTPEPKIGSQKPEIYVPRPKMTLRGINFAKHVKNLIQISKFNNSPKQNVSFSVYNKPIILMMTQVAHVAIICLALIVNLSVSVEDKPIIVIIYYTR